MRTDSVSLAAEAVGEIRESPPGSTARTRSPTSRASTARSRRTRRKRTRRSARPRPRSRPPTSRARSTTTSIRLYALIWKRAVASQMSHAVFDTVAVDMLAGADGPQRHLLRANGSTLVKPGYIAVYQEGSDDPKADDADHVLPPMNEGDSRESQRARRRRSTSPSRRRATPRHPSSRRSRSTASGAPRPTPRSSRRSRTANTSIWTIGASSRPTSARSSTAS